MRTLQIIAAYKGTLYGLSQDAVGASLMTT